MKGTRRLRRLLAGEQRGFLARDRENWGDHLSRVRAFLGAGLAASGCRPALILGAGAGLEIPWAAAPRGTMGWDADPWSRAWTLLRHHRWAPWCFEDLTGGLADLDDLARRCLRQPWGRGLERPRDRAIRRLAALLASARPWPRHLELRLAELRPGAVLSANVLGQLGVVAQRLLEFHLGPWPWILFPRGEDPVSEALEEWIAHAVRAQLKVLAASAAPLWLIHDRAVIHGSQDVSLGPLREPWEEQLEGGGSAELEDALAGVDVRAELQLAAPGRELLRHERWLWPVAPGQLHLVEAVALGPPTG
ncbi:MAG: hypothetical protein HY823_08180 [Acidobacteria bacterium]|nr:hypothetical protein [Acidobacteriota bacterium]